MAIDSYGQLYTTPVDSLVGKYAGILLYGQIQLCACDKMPVNFEGDWMWMHKLTIKDWAVLPKKKRHISWLNVRNGECERWVRRKTALHIDFYRQISAAPVGSLVGQYAGTWLNSSKCMSQDAHRLMRRIGWACLDWPPRIGWHYKKEEHIFWLNFQNWKCW